MKWLWFLCLIFLIGCCHYPFHGYNVETGQFDKNHLDYPHPKWWLGVNGIWPHKPEFLRPMTLEEEKEYFKSK
jgi:hypothetical protein